MSVKTYAIFVYVTYMTSLVCSNKASPNPCLPTNHRNVSHLYERYTKLTEDCPYTDSGVANVWYYAGEDAIVTFPPEQYCACGYKFPIWMNGTLPGPSGDIVNRTACVKFITACHQTLDIKIKNCGQYYVYHLTPGPDDSGYCFGIEKPSHSEIPPGHHLDNLPTVNIALYENATTAYSFTTLINISVTTVYNITAAVFHPNGSMIKSIQMAETSFVKQWNKLSPETNYMIQIYTYVRGEKHVLATIWAFTKPFQKPTATIQVRIGSINTDNIDIVINYDHGSEALTAEGRVIYQNGSVFSSFEVNKPVCQQNFQNLKAGTCYDIEVFISRQGENVILDRVQVLTKPEIQTYIDTANTVHKHTVFRCKFESFPDYKYNVRWTIQRVERSFDIDKNDTDGNLNLDLTESDLLRMHVHLPFNISCAFSTEGTGFSVPSDIVVAGIRMLTPHLSMYREETNVIRFIPTIPFGCYKEQGGVSTCNLTVYVSIPVQRNCTGISARKCSLQIHGDESTEHSLEIQATEDGQYGLLQDITYDVILRTISLEHSIWSNYILQGVKVTVLPERDTYWRGKRCEALNDPHMYTFDALQYEHHESMADEYVMYAHEFYNAKVHHKLERCNSRAMCNCGVAVEAGRDIYRISTCNNVLEIGYTQCKDGVLLVKQETDSKYTIYFPYGTYVTARLDRNPYRNSVGGMVVSVSIYPSVHDQNGRSKGLCGTLDNNRGNEFQGRNGEFNITRLEFIHSWRVPKDESLFQSDVKSKAPWGHPACSCHLTNGDFTGGDTCLLGADRSCSKGKTVGKKTCKMAEKLYIKNKNSLSIPTLDLNTGGSYKNTGSTRPEGTRTTLVSTSDSHMTTTAHSEVIWDADKAKAFCMGYMEASRAFGLCSRVPFTDTERAVETCIQDIVLTQSTEWNVISRQSMQDSCLSEIHRNQTVRDEQEREMEVVSTTYKYFHSTRTTPDSQNIGYATAPSVKDMDVFEIIDAIEEVACPNECSDHGDCKNGICKCKPGYGMDDCSVNCTKPPIVASFLHGAVCDERFAECTHVFIYGGIFARESVKCHITTFETHALKKGRQHIDAYVVPGQAQSLVEVICPLRPDISKRSVPIAQDAKLLSCYRVSVSNDGIHHGTPLDMCVYNSECQSLLNSSDGLLTTVIKDGFCFIDGNCIPRGMQNWIANTVCEPNISLYNWALKPTSTLEPISVTSTANGNMVTSDENTSSWMTPVIAAVACLCTVCVTVALVLCIRKNKRRNTQSREKGEKEDLSVSYKHDLDYDEETYAHIDQVKVTGDIPYVKDSTPVYNYVDDYTSLDSTTKDKVHYAKLNATKYLNRENGPKLPDRYQIPNISSDAQFNPYFKLSHSNHEDREYEKLKYSDDGYLTTPNQLKVSQRKGYLSKDTIIQKGEEIYNGYERPVPRK